MRRLELFRVAMLWTAVFTVLGSGHAAAQQQNTVLVSPGSFVFTHQFGNPTPPVEQNLNVLSTSGNVPFSITFAPSEPANVAPWIILAPVDTSGTLQTPSIVRVVPVPQNLPVGTYTGKITITANNVTNPTATIQVTLRIVPQSELDVSPKNLTFTSAVNQAPAQQSIQVNSTGSPLAFSATPTQNNGPQGWLVVDPATGTTNRPVTVSVNSTNLAPGTYTGVVNIASGGAANSPQQVQVTYTVTATPTLTANPAGLTFNFQVGTTAPAAQTVAIASATQNVTFAATADPGTTPGWLAVSPASATTPSNLSVSVLPANLPPGAYTGRINVSAQGLGTLQIPVTLNISTTPLLDVSASALTFNSQFGQAVPQQTINLGSTSTPLNFNFDLEPVGSWLVAGATGAATPASLVIGVLPQSLQPGTYTGKVTIRAPQAGNNPQVVNVTLNVSTAVVLQVSQATLNFTASSGGPTPAFQTFNVTSSDGSPQTFNITRTTSDGGQWLVVDRASATTPANGIQVAVNQAGLAPGNYTGSVVVTPANSGGPPQTVQVNLTVSGQSSFTATPATLAFTQIVGSNPPAAQTVQLTSAPSNLAFVVQIPQAASWLTVSATGGNTPATLTFTANGTNLAPGTYNAAVAILAGNNPQQTIPVTLTVASSASLQVAPTSLTFNYASGGQLPAAQQLAYSSNGGAIDFRVAGSANWIRLSPAEGRTPASVNVTIDPTGLAPGTYDGQITSTATGVNVPAPVAIRLVITGPPAPSITDFQNGASFLASAAAPGQIITIRGVNLGPDPGVAFTLNAQGRVPTVVSDTRVFFDGIAAPVIYASRQQVNAIVPYALAGRFSTRVQVEYLNQRSNTLDLRVVDSAPGVFTTGGGRGQAALLNQNSSVNSSTNPAARGSIVQIFLTGEGATRPEGIDGFVPLIAADLRTPGLPVVVRIGGVQAETVYAGSAPQAVLGLMQINARVPQNIGTGNQS
ncbi:MAG TPA: IPT/TIG domain-containing protein, partial [Bryobacteraceae bacterium]|nr:IPT/TIG domain-containing protein [Bryobacteraceae bacterium]